MINFLTNPYVIGAVIAVMAVLIFRNRAQHEAMTRKVNEIAREGEEQKGLKGDPRDSRKQGVVAIKSVIENSERPKSGRSESSMEERAHQLQARGIIVDRPMSLHEAEQNLDHAHEELERARNAAKWGRTPTLLVPKVREAEAIFELRREQHNQVMIETRDRTTVCRGKLRSGRQHYIGPHQARGAM